MRNRLLVALFITVLAALFASQNPDGLDKVANVLGFADFAKDNTALMKDYTVGFVKHPQLSTILAGTAGVLIVYGIFELVFFLFQKKNKIIDN